MAAMGKPLWSLAETKARVRLSLRESFPLHFGERWEEARRDLSRLLSRDPSRTAEPHCRAAANCCAGSPRKAFFSASSATRPAPCCGARPSRSAGRRYFGSVVGRRRRGRRQAGRRAGPLALEPSGIAAGEAVWFVGDTGVDMECAGNSGCVPVLLGGEPASEGVAATTRRVLRFPILRHCFALSRACDLPRRAYLRIGSRRLRRVPADLA